MSYPHMGPDYCQKCNKPLHGEWEHIDFWHHDRNRPVMLNGKDNGTWHGGMNVCSECYNRIRSRINYGK